MWILGEDRDASGQDVAHVHVMFRKQIPTNKIWGTVLKEEEAAEEEEIPKAAAVDVPKVMEVPDAEAIDVQSSEAKQVEASDQTLDQT